VLAEVISHEERAEERNEEKTVWAAIYKVFTCRYNKKPTDSQLTHCLESLAAAANDNSRSQGESVDAYIRRLWPLADLSRLMPNRQSLR
jgi:hypothetical protein